jgi:hypothetical protein
MYRKTWLIGIAALATSQAAPLAWASELQVKVLAPSAGIGANGATLGNAGEGGAAADDVAPLADDHIVAVLSYEKLETTQQCGGPMGRTLMKITVHADGSYSGVETSSRLYCPGSGLVRKALYSKHEGKLSTPDLARLWNRLGEITAQSRDLAAVSPKIDPSDRYQTRIQRSEDLRGVLSERDMPEIVQTGAAALASARFMQAFILEGKIN